MIRLEKITKTYHTNAGTHTVFKDLDLEIPTGCGVAFLGPNGVGKTTLINIIGGAEKPNSGQIFTDGRISWPVGLAGGFQPSLTARENVKFVARLYANKQDVKEIVRFVEDFAEIGEYFDMPIRTYSSGMRSRVSFGLSMAFDFDYYLIDEVTAVGDPAFKKKCNEALAQKRQSEAGFIVVSHQMDIVKKFCDYVAILSPDGVRVFDDVQKGIDVYMGKNQPVNPVQVHQPLQQALALKPFGSGAGRAHVCRPDRIQECFFNLKEKKLHAKFHIVALFTDSPIHEFILCDSSTGLWQPISHQVTLSPGASQKHPDVQWSRHSRFIFELELPLAASPVHAAIMARCGDDLRPLVRFAPQQPTTASV